MDKRWLNLFFGQVQIEVSGRRTELLINRCIEHGITVTNIRRTGKDRMVCTVPSEDIRKLRPLLRQSHCKFHILKRNGFPFFINKLVFKKGFIAGLALFAAVLFTLSNMLWRIDIDGATPTVEHQIRQVLDEIGVERGKFQFQLPDPEQIQYVISDRVDKVAWVGASLDGTTYTFRVVEKELPEEEKSLTPRNLVAKKEAVIYDIYVEKGKAVVEPNDYVQKGDVLISGKIGDEEHQKVIPAKGKVLGETWYQSRVTVPLVTQIKTYTGKSYTEHALNIFGLRIPVWGFSEPDFKPYDVKTAVTPLEFFGWKLPVSYESRTYMETKKVKREYSKKEAVRVAARLGRKELLEKLDHNDKIKSGKILRQSLENGKVKVLMYFTVIEDIAVEQPLIESKETE